MILDSPTMGQIVSNVFDEMLQMPTTPVEAGSLEAETANMVATIKITGATQALIMVEAPSDTARTIGETMFEAESDSLCEEEIRDAIGEIVNMIGGNVKGMYEGESQLSLPCVSHEISDLHRQAAGQSTSVHVCGLPLTVYWKSEAN